MTKINPNSQWFVVLDANDNCVAKYDTNADVDVPIDNYDVVKLDGQGELDNYDYDSKMGYQT